MEQQPRRGLLETLRRIGGTSLAILHNRLELLSVELQQEKTRVAKMLVLVTAAAVLGTMAVVMMTITVIILAGEKGRLPVLISLSVAYIIAAVAAALGLRKLLKEPPPLRESLAELKRDEEWLNSRQ